MNPTSSVAAVMGAYIADAAALGLHWIYDPERISSIISREGGAAFVAIDAANYADVPAYFAHGQRETGMLSQYGECQRLAVDVLNAHDGLFDVTAYQQAFAEHFGMGGRYVGYIDRPTRAAVNNILADQNPSGSDDDQLPALTRLPAVVASMRGHAAFDKTVKAAIEITHVNDQATRYAQVFVSVLLQVLDGRSVHDALTLAAEQAPTDIKASLLAAITSDESDSVAYGAITERACHLHQGMPLAFHILARAETYAEAVTRNIAAGGDSCGRSIAIGSVMGAAHGLDAIPTDWQRKLHDYDALLAACQHALR